MPRFKEIPNYWGKTEEEINQKLYQVDVPVNDRCVFIVIELQPNDQIILRREPGEIKWEVESTLPVSKETPRRSNKDKGLTQKPFEKLASTK